MASTRKKLPTGIWILGFTSLFMDISSEMIHSLLPLFMTSVLGASALWVGLVEGVGEATAMLVKVVSGPLSDYMGKRKPLAVLGYGLGALSKPLFAIAPVMGWVLGARVIDRIGKGMRGAPRDALIADLTEPSQRGAAYGLRQSLDTIGAFLGPLLAVGLMYLWNDDFRSVFWVAAIPGFIAVSLLFFGIRERGVNDSVEPNSGATPARTGNPFSRVNLASMSTKFWCVVAVGALFSLARFSEGFLVLLAQQHGLVLAFIPLVLVLMSVVYSLAAYPVGLLADKMDASKLLSIGILLLVAADMVMAHIQASYGLWLGIVLWGLHMGFTQGVLSTLVARHAPVNLRGTAFGLFNFCSGLAVLGASLLAGFLWESFGSFATFYTGAGLAGVSLLVLWSVRV